MNSDDKISTSALAKRLGLPTAELFKALERLGWIVRLDQHWALTAHGREQCGEIRQSQKFGAYIVWPPTLKIVNQVAQPDTRGKKVTATSIAQQVNLSPRMINLIFAELGWLVREGKGWRITPQGLAEGATQRSSARDISYALWPANITEHPAVSAAVKGMSGDLASALDLTEDQYAQVMRMFPLHYHTLDGRVVCSRLEMVLANWLYLADLTFSYRRILSHDLALRPDFYLPSVGVLIECWHTEHDARYVRWKCEKIERLKTLNYDILELREGQLINIESVLIEALRQQGTML